MKIVSSEVKKWKTTFNKKLIHWLKKPKKH